MNYFLAIRAVWYKIFSWHRYGHGVHSPFVYNLVRNVFADKTYHNEYSIIIKQKTKLLKNKTIISVQDFGAKSSKYKTERTVSSITKKSAIQHKHGQLLFRLVQHFSPSTILELGSSIGISASWMSLAAPQAKIFSIEGCPEIAKIAQETLTELGCHNVQIITGCFEEQLPLFLKKCGTIDFIYIDGNHQYENTMHYFHSIINNCNEQSVLLFDDIYWSKGMAQAWNEIKADHRVSQTIDILQWGIVFLRKGVAKEDFIIRY